MMTIFTNEMLLDLYNIEMRLQADGMYFPIVYFIKLTLWHDLATPSLTEPAISSHTGVPKQPTRRHLEEASKLSNISSYNLLLQHGTKFDSLPPQQDPFSHRGIHWRWRVIARMAWTLRTSRRCPKRTQDHFQLVVCTRFLFRITLLIWIKLSKPNLGLRSQNTCLIGCIATLARPSNPSSQPKTPTVADDSYDPFHLRNINRMHLPLCGFTPLMPCSIFRVALNLIQRSFIDPEYFSGSPISSLHNFITQIVKQGFCKKKWRAVSSPHRRHSGQLLHCVMGVLLPWCKARNFFFSKIREFSEAASANNKKAVNFEAFAQEWNSTADGEDRFYVTVQALTSYAKSWEKTSNVHASQELISQQMQTLVRSSEIFAATGQAFPDFITTNPTQIQPSRGVIELHNHTLIPTSLSTALTLSRAPTLSFPEVNRQGTLDIEMRLVENHVVDRNLGGPASRINNASTSVECTGAKRRCVVPEDHHWCQAIRSCRRCSKATCPGNSDILKCPFPCEVPCKMCGHTAGCRGWTMVENAPTMCS